MTDLPIVAGLAGPSTEAAVRQATDFKAAGADALLVFPIPAYLCASRSTSGSPSRTTRRSRRSACR